ncbi:hypothetical protein Pcinc_007843 [Petrolisthes cinctipes]|uniref:Uncharacterized protein n=1 Tax=Petrolisthes cinctipes TaxID=88211 RepID=A0AAE1KXT0_PETCI|nr:hypothetical protein Pcinc_007843 [Petrolisthes cinctipes]
MRPQEKFSPRWKGMSLLDPSTRERRDVLYYQFGYFLKPFLHQPDVIEAQRYKTKKGDFTRQVLHTCMGNSPIYSTRPGHLGQLSRKVKTVCLNLAITFVHTSLNLLDATSINDLSTSRQYARLRPG